MLKVLCCLVITTLLPCVARISEATEVIVTIDRFIYAQKDYGDKSPTFFGYYNGQGQSIEIVYPTQCPDDNGYHCFAPDTVLRRDQVRGLASIAIVGSDRGFSWYGTAGLWRWSIPKLRSDAELECGLRACWWDAADFHSESRSVVYAGGGMQYRFDWASVSLTPFVGVVGHWPRIESVSGTNHLFQLGLRAGVRLSARSELLIQYSHFSNGNRLRLADQNVANQGIEAVSLGLGLRF